jgi:hypothetical protein
MARIRISIFVTLAALASVAVTHAGGTSSGPASGCNLKLPPLLGGCGARSPYMDELQAGISGFAPPGIAAKHRLSGWIEILNTGPTMPHLVVEVDTSGSFTAQNIYAAFNTGRQKYRRAVRWLDPQQSPFLWDFGRFPAGAVAKVHFRIRLANGCSYRMDLRTYGALTPLGGVNLAAVAWGSGFGASGGVGNCPIPPPRRI